MDQSPLKDTAPGKPGVALSSDAWLGALWERNRVWTYRITTQ